MYAACCDYIRSWWWDSYIDPANLYWRYAGISKFVQLVNWTTLKWRPATVESQPPAVRWEVVTAVPLEQVRGRLARWLAAAEVLSVRLVAMCCLPRRANQAARRSAQL